MATHPRHSTRILVSDNRWGICWYSGWTCHIFNRWTYTLRSFSCHRPYCFASSFSNGCTYNVSVFMPCLVGLALHFPLAVAIYSVRSRAIGHTGLAPDFFVGCFRHKYLWRSAVNRHALRSHVNTSGLFYRIQLILTTNGKIVYIFWMGVTV